MNEVSVQCPVKGNQQVKASNIIAHDAHRSRAGSSEEQDHNFIPLLLPSQVQHMLRPCLHIYSIPITQIKQMLVQDLSGSSSPLAKSGGQHPMFAPNPCLLHRLVTIINAAVTGKQQIRHKCHSSENRSRQSPSNV